MVLIEAPTGNGGSAHSTLPKATTPFIAGTGTASVPSKPRDSAFDQVDALFPDVDDGHERNPMATSTSGSPNLDYDAENFDDAVEAAERIEAEPPRTTLDPNTDWTNTKMQRWRPWILVTGAGLLGVIGAIGVIRLLVQATVATDTAAETATDTRDDSPHNSVATSAAESHVNNSDDQPSNAIESSPQNNPTPADHEQAADDSPNSVLPNHKTDRTTDRQLENAIPPTGDISALNGTPKPKDQFGELIDLSNDSPPGPRDANNDSPEKLAAEDPSPDSSSSFAIAVIDKRLPGPIDVTERLGQTLPSIQLQQIPLYRFVDFISDLTAVPVSIRWDAIMHAGNTASRPVAVDLADKSIEDILQSVLTPLRLAAVPNGSHIEITKQVSPDGLRTTRYLVEDLINAECSIADVGRLVQQLVAPGTWKGQINAEPTGLGQMAESNGRLAIKQTETAHFETVLLLEQLRVARGRKPLSTYPPELFRLSDRRGLLSEVRTRSVRIRSADSLRLADLFRRLAEAAGCIVLPDWPGIAEAGWGMNTELEVYADEMPFDDMLQQLDSVLGLTYRVLDSRNIEITSKDRERTRAEFSFYNFQPLRKNGFTIDTMTDRIQQAIGIDAFRQVRGVVAFDASSDHIIIRLPQSLQVLVREFLTTWGA